ncbi:MAG: lipid-A-disaccharide synthase [Solitalea-like symbiont of Tyrophagus putrescentiae]
MKYYIIAGEASGDLHASNLMLEIKTLDPKAKFRFIGGDKMESVDDAVSFMHYKNINIIGFTAIFKNIIRLIKILVLAKKDIKKYNPDILILVDFAGFNLKIAKYAKNNGIKVCYYILPKAWAWKPKRALQIKKYTDIALSILPFEINFYKKYDVKAIYVGNPVNDAINNYNFSDSFLDKFALNKSNIIAMLPGSRESEIKAHMPILNSLASRFPSYHFIIAANKSSSKIFSKYKKLSSNVKIVFDHTYDLLKNAKVGIIKSGTSSLEASLLKLPHMVIYKLNWLNYLVAYLLVKIKYVSLINLILNKEVVKEYLQYNFNLNNLSDQLNKLLNNSSCIDELNRSFDNLSLALGSERSSGIAAKHIINLVK